MADKRTQLWSRIFWSLCPTLYQPLYAKGAVWLWAAPYRAAGFLLGRPAQFRLEASTTNGENRLHSGAWPEVKADHWRWIDTRIGTPDPKHIGPQEGCQASPPADNPDEGLRIKPVDAAEEEQP